MCRILIECQSACERLEDAQQLGIVKFFDRAAVSDDARDFVDKSCEYHSIFFNFEKDHWLSRVWVKRNFPGAMAIQEPVNIDIAIGCCPIWLNSIQAGQKFLLHNGSIPDNLPEGILLVNNWQEVATIVANYHK